MNKYFKNPASLNVYDKYTRCFSIDEYKIEYQIKTPDFPFPSVSILQMASYHNDVETIEFLFRNGVRIPNSKYNSLSPLYLAAKNGSYEAIKLLLNHGSVCELWKKGSREWSILWDAPPDYEHLLTVVPTDIAVKLIKEDGVKIKWYLESYHEKIKYAETVDDVVTLIKAVVSTDLISEHRKLIILRKVMDMEEKPEIFRLIQLLKPSNTTKLFLFKDCSNEEHTMELFKSNIVIKFKDLRTLAWDKIDTCILHAHFEKCKNEFMQFLVTKNGPIKTVKLFLEKFTDVNMMGRTPNDKTLFMECQDPEVLKELLEYSKKSGYDIKALMAEKCKGMTAYDMAYKVWDLRKVFLDYGYLPIDKHNKFQLSSEQSVLEEEIRYFLERMNTRVLFHVDHMGRNLLFFTTDLENIKKLVIIGVPMNQRNIHGNNPVSCAKTAEAFLAMYRHELGNREKISTVEQMVVGDHDVKKLNELLFTGLSLNEGVETPYPEQCRRFFGSDKLFPLLLVKEPELAEFMFRNGANVHVPDADWRKCRFEGGLEALLILQCKIRGESYQIENEWENCAL